MLVYMVKGKLPWMSIQTQDKMEKYKKIQEMKMSTPIEKLCEGLPKVLCKLMLVLPQIFLTCGEVTIHRRTRLRDAQGFV